MTQLVASSPSSSSSSLSPTLASPCRVAVPSPWNRVESPPNVSGTAHSPPSKSIKAFASLSATPPARINLQSHSPPSAGQSSILPRARRLLSHQRPSSNASSSHRAPARSASSDMDVLPVGKQLLLSSRSEIDCFDAGLTGVLGAQKVISILKARRSGITKLSLSHNALGNAGTVHLFTFLCSPVGASYRTTISEISLNGNGVGTEGLLAITQYMRDNNVLKTLWLQNNAITTDSAVISFAQALSKSRLRLLALTGNAGLGDQFIERFLPVLNAPHLKELHLNAIGMTRASAPFLSRWLQNRDGSTLCLLETLKCSGNNLGARGVWEVIRAIEKGNYRIERVEMYANRLGGAQAHPLGVNEEMEGQGSGQSGQEGDEVWKEAESALRRVLSRNTHMKRQTEKEALRLLIYSRALLFRSRTWTSHTNAHSSPLPHDTAVFPFRALPTELQLHILALFAPTLSSAQRTRIYNYASDPSTLPALLPALQRSGGKGCLADPTSLGSAIGFEVTSGSGRSSGACAEGRCMGAGNSLVCRREEERARWLELVGCAAYEPEVGEQA